MDMHLMRPEWLWTLVPALMLIVLLWRQRGRAGSWDAVIAPELLRHLVGDSATARGRNLLPFVLLGWLIAAVAASGPSWQKMPQPVHQKQDALVVLLDLSASMKSADLAPSRVDRARQKVLDLLQQRREGQTGLIAYAGDSHIVTPLTDDTTTIANLLPALNPDMMPLPGSDPVSAVKQALELLRSAGIRQGKILLLTDGVSDRDSDAIEKVMVDSQSRLSIIGIGTETGAPIPLPGGGFIKDGAGAIVLPSLDERGLRELAKDVGGSYRRLQIDDTDLEFLQAESLLYESDETLALDRTADAWEDQGYFFILALLPLALALFRRGWILTALPILFLLQPEPATAGAWDDLWLTPDQQGQQALQKGDAQAAATLFKNAEWAGTAAYRSEDYESAVTHFNDPDNANSTYNQGNALAQAGQLDEAIAAYEESLKLQPDRSDALENIALLEKLKEQQEQQQEQQDQQQQEQQEQQQDQQDQQGQQQDQQDQQDQQGQEQDQQDQQGQEQEQAQQNQQEQPQQNSESEDEPQPAESESPEEPQELPPIRAAEAGDEERDQAMEQWLRRIPDDPSGLLQRKFRYESLQRQEQGLGRDDETY